MRSPSPAAILAVLLLPALACAPGAAPAAAAPAPTSSLASAPDLDSRLTVALSSPDRPDRERARDAARHPRETLEFFGLRPDAKVVELWPGGGYYTAILAPVLSERGKLTITRFDPHGDPKSEDTQEAREIVGRLAKQPGLFSRVEQHAISAPSVDLGPEGSADLVLTFRNVHNWIEAGYAPQVFAAIARVLRSGGSLGVEEHRGKPGMTVPQIKDSGYVPEDEVVRLAADAGLRLEERSEINANPRDSKDHPHGVWSLPPSLAGGPADRARFEAIGESDRMTLRFVKP